MIVDMTVYLWMIIAGIGIGFFYFGGLWLTVNQLRRTAHPSILFLGSFLSRTLISLGGFYLVSGFQWDRVLGILIGFLLVRTVVVHRWPTMGSLQTQHRPAESGA